MSDAPPETTRYLELFEPLERGRSGAPDAWTAALRREALERFLAAGFPRGDEESWRFTSVAPIARTPFVPEAAGARNGLTPADVERFTFEPWDCTHLVFVNGHLVPELSRLRPQPQGVVLTGLAEALARHRDLVEPHLARLAGAGDRPFVALNTAFLQDGVFLHVPDGVTVEEPIHLVFVAAPHGGRVLSCPRNLVVAGERSRAAIVESYVGAGSAGTGLTAAVTEIAAGRGAAVDHYRVQRESESAFHVATVKAVLDRGAAFGSFNLNLGGAMVRNDIEAVLAGEGAECRLDGLYVVAGSQHVDSHTLIDHAAPHGTSRELYKGVLDGRSRGVFDGTIVVRQDASGTDARQTNKNLLLSEESLVDSNPRLQILNDDVRCTHGATIGQLDEDALFYLRARGVGEEAARNLLIQAFVGDVVHRIGIDALRAGLECLLFTRLHRGHRPGGVA